MDHCERISHYFSLFCSDAGKRAIWCQVYARKLQPMMLTVNDVSVIADRKDNRYFEHPSSLDEF